MTFVLLNNRLYKSNLKYARAAIYLA